MNLLSYILSITYIFLADLPPVYSAKGAGPLLGHVWATLRGHVGLTVLTVAATGAAVTWLLTQYNAGRRLKEFVGSIKSKSRQLKGLTILSCSKSGRTQKLAEILQKDAGRREINATIVNIENYDPANIFALKDKPGHLIVLLVQREAEDSEDEVWFDRWLHEGATGNLSALSHAVVSVEEAQHALQGCKVASDVDKSLTEHGSHRIVPLCTVRQHMSANPHGERGFSCSDAEGDFVAWTEELWAAVESHYSNPFKKPCSCSNKSCCTKEGGESAEEGGIVDIEDLVASSLRKNHQAEGKPKHKSTPHRPATSS